MMQVMKKAILPYLLLCFLFAWPTLAFAEDADALANPVYYKNDVYPISNEELSQLEQKMTDIGISYGIDAVILFVETVGEERLSEYSQRIYQEGVREGIYQREGIVLCYSRTERLWAIYATSRAANLISEQDKDDLWEAYLSGEGSFGASMNYLNALATHLEMKGVQPIPEDRMLPRLVDEADLFTDQEEKTLLAQLDEVSERQECDVIIVTVNSLDGKDPMAYADDFFDYNGYGYGEHDDGILYLLSMEYRDQAYSTYGFGITAFTDAGQDYIFDAMKADLKNNDWFDAFMKYIPLCDEFLTAARNGEPMDVGNLPKPEEDISVLIMAYGTLAFVGLGISVLIAYCIVKRLVSKTSSGGIVSYVAAHEYAVPNSLHFTRSDQTFIDNNISKTIRVKTTSSGSSSDRSSGGSSTHASSSGRSHGGSSNKF